MKIKCQQMKYANYQGEQYTWQICQSDQPDIFTLGVVGYSQDLTNQTIFQSLLVGKYVINLKITVP